MSFTSTTLLLSFVRLAFAEFSMPNAVTIYDLNTGNNYAVFESCANYNTAKSTCEGEPNTHLVHLETEAEQDWLYQQLTSRSLPTKFWIGLEMVDGVWQWVDNLVSTPLVESHRFNVYNSYGPSNGLTDNNIEWRQMSKSNCFPYTCEHSTPVTMATTQQTACTTMHKDSGPITNAALITATPEPNFVSCARTCFSTDECIASQFNTSTVSCSLYRTGSFTFGCGVEAVTFCHFKL